MDRKHLSKLTNEQLGVKGIAGWYLEQNNRPNMENDYKVIFQCPNCNSRAGLKLHSIDSNGEVNASVLCIKNDYHEMVILDNWDKKHYKIAGEPIIKIN